LEDEAYKKRKLEEEVVILQSQLLQLTFEADQVFNLEILGSFLFPSTINHSNHDHLLLGCVWY
jgi:hypothetical protein